MTHWRELITHGTPQEPVPQKEMMNTPQMLTSGAGETGQRRILDEMRLASKAIDESSDPSDYHMGLIALAMIAREFVRVAASGETPPAQDQRLRMLDELHLSPDATLQSVQRHYGVTTPNAMRLLSVREFVLSLPSMPPATTALREALERYAQHLPVCRTKLCQHCNAPKWMHDHAEDIDEETCIQQGKSFKARTDCSCGLDAALRTQEQS